MAVNVPETIKVEDSVPVAEDHQDQVTKEEPVYSSIPAREPSPVYAVVRRVAEVLLNICQISAKSYTIMNCHYILFV